MLTKLFYYLPLNALAANVIVAALSLVDFHEPGYFLLYLLYLLYYWYKSACFTSTKEAALLVDLHEPAAGSFVGVVEGVVSLYLLF